MISTVINDINVFYPSKDPRTIAGLADDMINFLEREENKIYFESLPPNFHVIVNGFREQKSMIEATQREPLLHTELQPRFRNAAIGTSEPMAIHGNLGER